MGLFGIFSKKKKETLDTGLEKTKDSVLGKISRALAGKSKVDDEVLDNLEDVLISSDVGVDTTLKIIKRIEERVARDKYVSTAELNGILRSEIEALLTESGTIDGDSFVLPAESKPYVIMVVGVNGVGKTTTIGKLARKFQNEGKSVMLAAGDTFRAAAVEQLQVWGERNNIPVVAQSTGSDSASVIFDAMQSAAARNIDILIADTAGRLQNKNNLMDELKKIVRVMRKYDETAPHEIMLTLDAGTGQNAISQAKLFDEAVGLTGISLTKLDGTAKGGVIFAIADQFNLPIRYIGVGEKIEDLREFNAEEFIEALFVHENEE